MATTVLQKELILLDLNEMKFQFYNITVESVGYNDLQIIFHYGKVNNKGTKQLIKSSSYKEAMAIAFQKFYEIKAKKYEEVEDMKGWLGQTDLPVAKSESNVQKENKFKKKKIKEAIKEFACDECKNSIKEEVYNEIDKWGRGGGGWDKNPSFVGYQKVLCIKCQWKHDIFKKRM